MKKRTTSKCGSRSPELRKKIRRTIKRGERAEGLADAQP